jgi:hypothetical protein
MRVSAAPAAAARAASAVPPPAASKLRVGVVLGGTRLRAWEASMLQRLRESDYAALVTVLLPRQRDDRPDTPGLPESTRRAGRLLRRPLHAVALALESKISCDSDAFAWDDTGAALRGLETIEADARNGRLELDAPDLRRAEALDLDVWVHLGGPYPGAAVQASARYGTWRLTHGGWPAHDPAAAGFWPVCLNATVIESALVAETDGRSTIVATSASGTNRYSVKLNRSALYWKTSSLLPRALAALHRREPPAASSEHREGEGARTEEASRVPTVGQLAAHVARNVKRRARDFLHRHFALDRWILLVHPGEALCTAAREFTKLVPPKDRFWADPHVVRKGDRYYVFIEELPFATGKGHISVLVLDAEGVLQGDATTVLERDYHLSYPCVFVHEGEYFMIPESSENRTIDLYRCSAFPFEWQFEKTLLKDIDAVDTTVVEHGGLWWLFAGVRENKGASFCEELFVFHANSPLGPEWTPHAANPVISDVRRARPAGAMFRRGGKLYRPAQDCSVRYGYAVTLNEVTRLTPTAYEETPVAGILPDWDRRIPATHTLAYTPGLTLIDALQPRLKL